MSDIQDQIAELLASVQTPGDFCCAGISDLHPPPLEVDGIGRIALPVLPAQAAQLIAAAEQAPFGRGTETLIDTQVRRTWQIAADRLHIGGRHWPATLQAIVTRVCTGLGVTTAVVPEPYKLLIYDLGGFFISHRDTEKSPGMFATLIIALPSLHAGGELLVRHGGREMRLDLASSDSAELAYAAFYADCVHEVLPVTEGHRVALVYNLLRKDSGAPPRPPNYDAQTAGLAALLSGWRDRQRVAESEAQRLARASGAHSAATQQPSPPGLPTKLVYPLAHAYTEAEVSFQTLKGEDAAAAAVLAAAADSADCELHVALMRIDESGSAEHSGYFGPRGGGRHHDDDDDESDFEIGEIFERGLVLSHWRTPGGSHVPLGDFPFIDVELCPLDAFEDVEPDEQEFHGTTGNEGASFDRHYQRAALVLWPRALRLQVLADAGPAVALGALAQLADQCDAAAPDARAALWAQAHELAGRLIALWPGGHGSNLRGQALALLARLNDTEHIARFIADISAAGRATPGDPHGEDGQYAAGDNAGLVEALTCLPAPQAGALVLQLIQARAGMRIKGCTDLLARASEARSAVTPGATSSATSGATSGAMPGAEASASKSPAGDSSERRQRPAASPWQPAAEALLLALPGDAPHRTAPPHHWHRETMDAAALTALLPALARMHATTAQAAADLVLASPGVYGLDAVIVPALRSLAQTRADFALPALQRLRAAGVQHLGSRIALPLAPPGDEVREARISCTCEHCQGLRRFLLSATESSWRLRVRQELREHVLASIQSGHCDADSSVERKGSPHVLVCTKNQASYERRVKQRRQDLKDLESLA